jgi:hypothetical protein
MVKKATAVEQARFFLYPESRIFVLHGGDLTLQANYEIHQKLVDEIHGTVGTWDITPLSDNPERARAQGIVYWQGRHVDSADGALLKCYVGEDWVVERVPSGELKFVVYVNTDHSFLPGSATVDI